MDVQARDGDQSSQVLLVNQVLRHVPLFSIFSSSLLFVLRGEIVSPLFPFFFFALAKARLKKKKHCIVRLSLFLSHFFFSFIYISYLYHNPLIIKNKTKTKTKKIRRDTRRRYHLCSVSLERDKHRFRGLGQLRMAEAGGARGED